MFINNEKENPCCILKRFCRTKSLGSMKQILDQPSANVSYHDFEDVFIKFCIKHKLFNVVFPCFQNSEFSVDRIESLCCESADKKDGSDWFRLWLSLKQLDGNLSHESIVYQAVISTNHFLSKGDVDAYLQEHPLVVLATIIYGNKMINDVVQKKVPVDFPVSSDCLQAVKRHLPLLEMSLLSQLSDFKKQPDVTVYQLLQGCSPFDVSKLFGWQSVHVYVSYRQGMKLFIFLFGMDFMWFILRNMGTSTIFNNQFGKKKICPAELFQSILYFHKLSIR